MGVPPKFLPDRGRITVPSGGKINEISVISIITDKSSKRNIHVQFVSFISIADETTIFNVIFPIPIYELRRFLHILINNFANE